jgi:transposase InsO family protein
MSAAIQLRAEVGTAQACDALGIPRATFYRKLKPPVAPPGRPAPPLALSDQERQAVLDLLHSERFQDEAPRQVFAVLLDEGRYHCSVRTMYRILKKEHGDVKERRRHVQRPAYEKPELLATRASEVWSWDITKLLGPAKWTYFYLYVIMDIFSRYVVGWMVAHRESAVLAKKLIEETCQKQRIVEGQLTVHADRGSPMTSKCLAHLLLDLGIVKTHSRPHVSNDNPYSEAQFKTLKYCPQFPGRFGSIQDARSFCREFFTWYNQEHRHSGIGLVTPEQLHYGLAAQVVDQRRQVLKAAFEANPARFKGKMPEPPALPTAAWINKPASDDLRV